MASHGVIGKFEENARRPAVRRTDRHLTLRRVVTTEPADRRAAGEPLAGHVTVLEALQAGIGRQLALLDDPELTGTGESHYARLTTNTCLWKCLSKYWPLALQVPAGAHDSALIP